MITPRIRPLLTVLALFAAVLLARLYEVQVVQHTVWAEEAARLVHSGREIPYRRGRILDTKGRVLARDRDAHQLVLVYREFRRAHPLGIVTHARTLLEDRAVPLDEAWGSELAWARELVALTPADLERFAQGGALATASLAIGACADERAAREQRRARRAKDLGFYVRRLLPLDTRQRRRLEKRVREGAVAASYLELAAQELREPPGPLWERIAREIEHTLSGLERLAVLLPWSDDQALRDPVRTLVDELERTRRWVEDATAAKLFAEAAGFVPGRLDARTLYERFDLSWIARLLSWDPERLEAWTRTAREGWRRGWRDGYALPRLLVRLTLDPARPASPERWVSSVSAVFREQRAVEAILDGEALDWRTPAAYPALTKLDDFLAADLPREALVARGERNGLTGAHVLAPSLVADLVLEPVGWDELYPGAPSRSEAWELVDRVWNDPPVRGDDAGASLERLFASRRWDAQERLLERAIALAEDWDAWHQARIVERLDALVAAARPEELTPDGRLRFGEASRERARERAEFFLKDYGMRPRRLVTASPDYEVIYLLTRYHETYPGFDAREVREREYPVLPGDRVRSAAGLVGDVTAVGIDDLVVQREASARLRELMDRPDRTDAEQRELSSLVGSVVSSDEVKGVAGVEGFWNRQLTGRNGYRETYGLEDVFGTGRRDLAPIEVQDGRDVTLTLDTDLQRAARRTLETPVVVAADERFDHVWAAEPVGAIALVTIEGDVLAAASEPNAGSPRGPGTTGQRALVLERTLRRPTFQPPGSVFKPFVAAYALARVGLDPNVPVTCTDIGGGRGAGYVDVRCHSTWGHGVTALRGALVHSCNAYFAWLGETLEEQHLRDVVRVFGFDQPTGLRAPPPGAEAFGTPGHFREDVGGMPWRRSLSDHDRRLAGNGLGVVEATPLALARAMIGLATGSLSDLRLVRAIGDEALPPPASRPVGLPEEDLAFVREALLGVTTEPGGTGQALASADLGFAVAAKTGSADLVRGTDAHGRSVVRKHAWVAGWVPPVEPKLVFVVFVHDTMATSSHGAVYVARDLLLRPAVLNWLAENGVNVSGVPAR